MSAPIITIAAPNPYIALLAFLLNLNAIMFVFNVY
jgi:hypothetical protein